MKVHDNLYSTLESIQSNMSILVHGSMATPTVLLDGLKEQAWRLENVELLHLHTCGDAFYANEQYKNNFRVTNFFVGGNIRKKLNYQNVDYLPCFLSEIPNLIKSKNKKIDVALIHVSPPDRFGYCTLGTSVDIMRAGVDSADIIIAQVNSKMPRVHGDGYVHVDQIDHAFYCDQEFECSSELPISKEEEQIGKIIAELIEDDSTLQMGIGNIPNAVLNSLKGHKNLGIHSEMFADGAIDLIESGVVNNTKKNTHPGKTVATFLNGSQRLLDFVDDNPATILLPANYVNNPGIIARNDKVVAINSALEVDLSGQVCADSLGHKIFSGVGGQMDFIRGASLSKGGKPIIALPSRTKKGVSKITCSLNLGAGVVTTRAHTHYVVTEFGVVNLYGKTLHERAKALIQIAHPEDREGLMKNWYEIYCKK